MFYIFSCFTERISARWNFYTFQCTTNKKKNSIENHRLMFSLELFPPPARSDNSLFSSARKKYTQQALAQQEFNEKIISVRFFARRFTGRKLILLFHIAQEFLLYDFQLANISCCCPPLKINFLKVFSFNFLFLTIFSFPTTSSSLAIRMRSWADHEA